MVRISSLPHPSTPSSSISTHQQNRSPTGISNTPSSLQMGPRILTARGFLLCLQEFFESLRNCFGLFSRSSAPTSTRFVQSVEERIAHGKNILERSFISTAINNDNGQHSAIVVIMKYNNRTVVSYGTATQQKNNLNAIKVQLRQLIASQPDVPHNTEISVHTLFFKKNNDNTYTYDETGGWMTFPNVLPAGALFSQNSGDRHSSDAAMTPREMGRTIGMWDCSQAEKIQIAAFLAGL